MNTGQGTSPPFDPGCVSLCRYRCLVTYWLLAEDTSNPLLYPSNCWPVPDPPSGSCNGASSYGTGTTYAPFTLTQGNEHWFLFPSVPAGTHQLRIDVVSQTGSVTCLAYTGDCSSLVFNNQMIWNDTAGTPQAMNVTVGTTGDVYVRMIAGAGPGSTLTYGITLG